jgi:hypothetical protein
VRAFTVSIISLTYTAGYDTELFQILRVPNGKKEIYLYKIDVEFLHFFTTFFTKKFFSKNAKFRFIVMHQN